MKSTAILRLELRNGPAFYKLVILRISTKRGSLARDQCKLSHVYR